jgi:hypothetical protein
MRVFCNSLMAVLVVAALFWGNCFSCPQILLAAQKHGCCPHGKADSKADPKECKTQGLRSFVKADPAATDAPAVVESPAAKVIPQASQLAGEQPPLQVQLFSPPDFLPLRV